MVLVTGGAFQGKKRFVRENFDFSDEKIFFDFHEKVKEYDNDFEKLTEHIIKNGYECVISDEIGCGVVPANENEIRLREAVGRGLCLISSKCSEVWRVTMGIGIRIK